MADILKGYRGNSTGKPPPWWKKLFSKKHGGEVKPEKRKTNIPLNKPPDPLFLTREEESGVTKIKTTTSDIATEDIENK